MKYSSIYLIAIATILAAIWYFFVTRIFNYWKRMSIPFEKPMPFVGNILDILMNKKTLGEICQDIYSKYQTPYVGMYVLGRPILLVRDLNLIKNILVKDFHNFHNRTIASNHRDDPIGSSMLFLERMPFWETLRKQMSPAFSSKKIRLMHQHILESAGFMMNYLEKETKINDVVDVRELGNKYATNSITSTAFGVIANSFSDENDPYRIHANKIYNSGNFWTSFQTSCYFIAPGIVKLCRFCFIDRQTMTFLSRVFWETINLRQTTMEKRDDIVDIAIDIMKNGDIKLDQHQITALPIQFYVAGYESSSSAISFGLYELARNPKVQDRLRDEILRVREKYDVLNYEALEEMHYLEMVIKEILRIYPPAPFLDRTSVKDYDLPGMILEKGTAVYISVLGVHFDPEIYPDPHRFDPLRFTPENIQNRPSCSYLAFGEGPRYCIGMRHGKINVKTALAHIIAQYEVETCSKTQSTMEFNPVGIFLQPKSGSIYLKLRKIRQ